uniref:Uncharacterized protein n=1 Tax=CrAss-like virus sp. ctRQZ5 TaxID=2826824 RepID=A0A8S5LXJ7_9CAUD|nr:MAG TPA: hypothetical protein [CrAss-like virus sp. ctRQZ5]
MHFSKSLRYKLITSHSIKLIYRYIAQCRTIIYILNICLTIWNIYFIYYTNNRSRVILFIK